MHCLFIFSIHIRLMRCILPVIKCASVFCVLHCMWQVCSVLESLEREYRRDEDWCSSDKATDKVTYIQQLINKHQEQKEAFLKVSICYFYSLFSAPQTLRFWTIDYITLWWKTRPPLLFSYEFIQPNEIPYSKPCIEFKHLTSSHYKWPWLFWFSDLLR
jgi:hypothetical protein